MNPEILIRKAKKFDLEALLELNLGLRNHHRKIAPSKDEKFYEQKSKRADRAVKKYYLEKLADRKALFLIAYHHQKLVGYCLSFIKETPPVFQHNKAGYIGDLFVINQYRGQGLGSEFIQISKRFFQKKKIKFMELSVRAHNLPAQKLYQKVGFRDYSKSMRMRI